MTETPMTPQPRRTEAHARPDETTEQYFDRLEAAGLMTRATLPLSAVRLPERPLQSHEEIDRILMELGYDVGH